MGARGRGHGGRSEKCPALYLGYAVYAVSSPSPNRHDTQTALHIDFLM